MNNTLLPLSLLAGIDRSTFWQLSIEEINNRIELNNELLKVWARKNYELAKLQAMMIGCILSGEPIPALEEVYPIFENTVLDREELTKEELQLAILKEQMIDFMNGHNKLNRS